MLFRSPYAHHECWDGAGYPRQLAGEAIPLAARVFAVVDVWDAMLADRPYRRARPREEALAYLRDQAGKHFDPKVVKAFVKRRVPSLLGDRYTTFLSPYTVDSRTHSRNGRSNGKSRGTGRRDPNTILAAKQSANSRN